MSLLYLSSKWGDISDSLEYLLNNFAGELYDVDAPLEGGTLYLCGDIERALCLINTKNFSEIYIVGECSYKFEGCNIDVIEAYEVPLRIHMGIYIRKFFDDANYFNRVENDHEFQLLTESNKSGSAYRKGIYLSNVEETENGSRFNLLRCSTNFRGPTADFWRNRP